MTSLPARLTEALADRYRVERELGQGGMATVYLADDLRHHRKVALKVLRPELAALIGGDRFLHEITTTANLQHPHILALFDSGQVNVVDARGDPIRTVFYVMPFVEGESLRDRLTREKQLPVDAAVRLAREVASALHYAHKRGVVHRDIKPENILLHDGQALVADFGIALAASTAGGSRLTETGLSLGTPQYMSPEQAMGERTLDARSDVYALGCVLYEMLAGEPPFTGPTVQAIVARVMTEAPRPLRVQRHTVPEGVEAAVVKALEKLPADRFASAAEFAEALARPDAVTADWGTTASRPVGRGAPEAKVSHALRLLPWAVAGLAMAVAAWSLTRKIERPVPLVLQYTMKMPDSSRILDIGGPPAALRPDGSGMVYVGQIGPRLPRVLVRWDFDGSPPVPIPGTENAAWPFFSPDGQWVGFLAGGAFRKVALNGGGAVTIGSAGSAAGSFRGASWTSKGEIIFGTSSTLYRIPADANEAVATRIVLTTPGQALFFPTPLPDGEWVVAGFLAQQSLSASQLMAIELATGKTTPLGLQGSNPKYVEPGFLAFTNAEGSLMAVRFDARRRRVLSSPRTIAQGMPRGTGGVGKLDVSRRGTVVYLEGLALEEQQLVRVDRRGVERVLPTPPRSYSGPRISPDGRRIAVSIGPTPNPPMDIWVYDLVLGTLARATSDSTSVHAEWSVDGRRLYHRNIKGGFRATATTVDGSAPPESLYSTAGDLWEVLPTRSGDTLITRELLSIENDRDLMLVPLRPAGPPVPLAAGPRIQAEPALSPDGKWLAYDSDESGSFEVYVRAFPGPGPRYQVSSGGGTSPRWSARGELFFLSPDSLIAVPVQGSGATLTLGKGKALFGNRFSMLNFHAPYDVAPDGSWFVFVSARAGSRSASFRLMHHWFEQPWK
ncbi:MAG TPA: protein kinase [Gemmatimonadales bacterium]|nr:protein kinase [Gemmatimonadales bacterium]